jgi:hypothetical protein
MSNKINYEKLNTCVDLLNQCINKYYRPYKFLDEHIFSEFTPCSYEEIKLLGESIEKLLELFTNEEKINEKFNENIIYWAVIYYYYNTIVIEYNVVTFFNQYKLKDYINKFVIPDLKKKQNFKEIDKIMNVRFKNDEIIHITKIMIIIASSDDEHAVFVRKSLKNRPRQDPSE